MTDRVKNFAKIQKDPTRKVFCIYRSLNFVDYPQNSEWRELSNGKNGASCRMLVSETKLVIVQDVI